MRVVEQFISLQGEGRWAGAPSVFIRLAGCPLHCRWCDTPYALAPDAGEERAIEDIVRSVQECMCRHVVVTGGEPLVAKGLEELLSALHQAGKYITLETSATEYREITCDLVSISPKLSNSTPLTRGEEHEARRLNPGAISRFITRHQVQLKFVVDSEKDLAEIDELLTQLPPLLPEVIMLMPQAADRAAYLEKAPRVAQWCLERGWSFSPRLHLLLWNGQKGY
ncbi:MAG: 7-carboxy-7-deazaguanine synthase QueE [Sedimentisphaerales bacterium]|nr:7-carboxy-7-deazaguanine synthase QueE [Sedimentisphaerales bacterium]